tara:strand:+ start:44 stop:496 length:453 start_codon:yes stop_codon:yes gene_type:complete
MKKIFILFLFFISACGYQPLYKLDKDFINLEINEVKLIGNSEISKKIIDKLPYTVKKNNKFLNKISIESTNNIIETSKNSKGEVTSYRTVITAKFKILNKDDEILSEKFLKKEFSYNSNENKFKFKEYQNTIEENLINKIAEDIIIDLNL